MKNVNALTINVGNNGDAINLLNFDQNEIDGSLVIRTLQFADGSQANLADFLNHAPTVDHAISDQTGTEDAAFI